MADFIVVVMVVVVWGKGGIGSGYGGSGGVEGGGE